MDKNNLLKTFENNKLDVIISSSEQTRIWLAKIQTSFGYLFIEKDQANLFVDGRYIELALEKAKNVKTTLLNSENIKQFVDTKLDSYKRIGIEKEYLTIEEFELFKKWFPNSQFIPISGQKLRIIKSQEEIDNLQKVCLMSLNSLEAVEHMIKPGISEKEIEMQLSLELKKNGCEKNSFDSIVVSGTRSSLPHGKPSNKILEDGDLVTVDFGGVFNGYCSDITRSFLIGKKDPKKEEIFNIVKEAQQLGIEAVKPGVSTDYIDSICRDYIKSKGYGEYFVHSTGHGLGIDVHELPNVSQITSLILEPGMVITVEPGIYIPNFGGVRFEDDILVTKDGYQILSRKEK